MKFFRGLLYGLVVSGMIWIIVYMVISDIKANRKPDYFDGETVCKWSPQPVCVQDVDGKLFGYYLGFMDDGRVIWKPVEVVRDGK